MRLIALAGPDGRVRVPRVRCADNALTRLRGLLARPPLGPGEALLLSPCASVHTCFMGAAIDVVYLDGDFTVVTVVAALPPWRLSAARGARHTLELAAGGAAAADLAPGLRLVATAAHIG